MDLVQYNENTAAAFGAAANALSGDTKPICKFDKGDWYLGQDKEEIANGTRFAANLLDAQWGWILWHDKKVDDRRMVTVASGKAISPRSELGHDDQGLWEKDKTTNKPIDPWAKTIEVPAREINGELREVTLSGSSKGWEGCCKALFKAFGDGMKINAGKVPIVELGTSKYQHREYGIVKVPTLTIVEWRDPTSLAAIPAEAEPKKQSKF